MSSSFLSHIRGLLDEQADQIKSKRTISLNNMGSKFGVVLDEAIELIIEYVSQSHPPVEIDRMSLQSNGITHLPKSFKYFSSSLKYLDLHDNRLKDVPEVLFSLHDLDILDLSSNKISHLPSAVSKLTNLRVLSLKENRFHFLNPVLGEMSLNLIEVANNPLIMPSMDLIKGLQMQRSDLDWVSELKSYLLSHRSLLESKITEQLESSGTENIDPLSAYDTRTNHEHKATIQPTIARSKSVSETKSKASKAARRMGLIIKPDDQRNNSDTNVNENTTLNHETATSPSDYLTQVVPHSASALETSFKSSTPPPPPFVMTTTATTGNTSQSNSPTSSLPNLSRSSSRNISRSNTLKDIDKMLDKNENVDTEHKSGAYFRRLSTLQEIPIDEKLPASTNLSATTNNTSQQYSNPASNSNSNNSSRQGSLSNQTKNSKDQTNDDDSTSKAPMSRAPYILNDVSPSRVKKHKPKDSATMIKVSRKVLFAFSELHSSVRRFTGFCMDKKITIKMASLLYTTKADIDSLVENLEVIEETGNNLEQIEESLQNCIVSFRSIMELLSENFLNFVMKIDVCFIRMLYLTLYGSFNELMNAYKILVPNAKSFLPFPPTAPAGNLNSTDQKAKLSINTNPNNETEDYDEKLYKSVEIATTNAQVVFSELTKAIGKSAGATSNSSSTSNMNPVTASKVKDLTTVCVSSTDITKRLKTKLITIRNNPSQTTKRLFWDDINAFLKAIIQTFSTVKGIMQDLPVLNEVRSSMANLTKTTKDVTIMLEMSSYKSISTDSSAQQQGGTSNHMPQINSIPSVTNIFTPVSAHPILQTNPLSSANLTQLNTSHHQSISNGPSSARVTNLARGLPQPNYSSTGPDTGVSSPAISPSAAFSGPITAPSQSVGQYFARNGMNPFDGLIMANEGEESNDS